jgi:hypothetical protein
MFALFPNSGPVIDATDPLNRFHETALREARYATEYHQIAHAEPPRMGIVARLRMALTGDHSASAETCSCPA